MTRMIEIDDARVEVGGVQLLTPTSVRVAPGEALFVRGANGAGKSTLLRTIVGAVAATAGSIRIAGAPADTRDPAHRRRVAAMIGLPAMAPDLTVLDHVLLVASTWFPATTTAEACAHTVLAELDLGPQHSRFPHELSSGQTQLFGLALTLARPFDVLVVDEPEQRLDEERISLVGQVLRRRRDDGASLVVASHSDALTGTTADRVLVLESGE